MSLKSIELQIAIPKTFDAGKVTEQKNQQSALNHQQAAAQTETQARKQRNTVMDSAQSEKMHNNNQQSGSGQTGDERPQTEQNQKESTLSHPYKGGFVDFSG
ncbi:MULTISPECIES: hypothetical protein [Sporosarcina]|uniref:hypothetical protein n=1 Tax=Sporosarcina TaxID=1569 RepID=UPI00059037F8|nr:MULTISPECIES: hypothetical protein [Sporosarcina]WJY28713.1 hypothetical protein QWT68_06935 [Sporosarcina sp. 0.2-SM1T-5]